MRVNWSLLIFINHWPYLKYKLFFKRMIFKIHYFKNKFTYIMNTSTHKVIREKRIFSSKWRPSRNISFARGRFYFNSCHVTLPSPTIAHTYIFLEALPWIFILSHCSTLENRPKRIPSQLTLLTFLYPVGLQYLVSLAWEFKVT